MVVKKQHRILQGLAVGALASLLAFLVWSFGWFDPWEAKTWDWRVQTLAKPGPATKDICLVLVDQNSLDWAKNENGLNWPWPRELYGVMINFFQRCGARAVALDVLFTEPSSYGVDDDAALAGAVARQGRVAGAAFLSRESGSDLNWPPGTVELQTSIEGLKEWLAQGHEPLVSFPRATFPIPDLAVNAAVLGNVNLSPDSDAVYRRVPLFGVFDGRVLPTLGLASLFVNRPFTGRIDSSQLDLDGVAGKESRTIPLDKRGAVLLRYRGPSGTHRALSAAAVIQSEIRIQNGQQPTLSPMVFKDKYVLVGFSAPGLLDLRPAPVGGVFTGVEIQATLLDNVLSGDVMRDVPRVWAVALTVLLALLCGLAVAFFSTPARSIVTGAVFLPIPVGCSLAAYAAGFWLPLVLPASGLILAVFLGVAANYAIEGRQKRFIKSAFGQYLSPKVIDQLMQHPEQLKLGGERKVLSIFFSDLQGFTSISEGLSPDDLTALLNDYLSAMTDIIHEEDGTVDKYEGDAIIAFWNAPLDVPDHAIRAVRAALRCQKVLAELRPRFRARANRDLLMRIGLNTGAAVVGNLGSHTRFDYTMLGDAVNLAARLEGVNKQFGTYLMISQSTKEQLDENFALRELARVAVVGRKEPVTVYEPMFFEDFAARKDDMASFARGLDLYYRGEFSTAAEVFSQTADRDPAAAAYQRKCRDLQANPPEDWQGVWVMTSK